MTLNTFLKRLELAAMDMEVNPVPGDPLRLYTKEQAFCPITAVCLARTGKVYRTREYALAAASLKLDRLLADRIVTAADWDTCEGLLRAQLCKAIDWKDA